MKSNTEFLTEKKKSYKSNPPFSSPLDIQSPMRRGNYGYESLFS